MIKYKNIIFTRDGGEHLFPPMPANKSVPNWYKQTPEYRGENGKVYSVDGATPHTIKKCIPVFDAMTAGYILYTEVDLQVSYNEKTTTFYFAGTDTAIDYHKVDQTPLYPLKNDFGYPKWINKYKIKTPPGYSTLFLSPMHNPNNFFTIFPGIVDTDKYSVEVNFPFFMNDNKWEGVIPAGTPMVQVIPFKRDSWKHTFGSHKEIKEGEIIHQKLRSFLYNSYKKNFWSKKDFK